MPDSNALLNPSWFCVDVCSLSPLLQQPREAAPWHPSNVVLTVTDSSITPLLRWLPGARQRIVKISAVVYRSQYVLLHCTPTWSCTSLHLPHLWLTLSLMFLIICLRLSLDFEFWSTLYADWSKRQEHRSCDNLDVSLCLCVCVCHPLNTVFLWKELG